LAPWTNGIITTAIRLNIFSIISARALTVDEIALESQANPSRLKLLLDACVSLGILQNTLKEIESH